MRIFISLFIGITGLFCLLFNIFYYKYPPIAHPRSLIEQLVACIDNFITILPTYLAILISFFLQGGAFITFFPLSIIGIFLSAKEIKSQKRKLAIFATIINLLNLVLCLLIAWLLFGLARGM